MPVLDWQLRFLGLLRVPESSTCDSDLSIPVETGRPPFRRMLKKAFGCVLASLRGSTYIPQYASPLRSLRPGQKTFLNILKDLRLGPQLFTDDHHTVQIKGMPAEPGLLRALKPGNLGERYGEKREGEAQQQLDDEQ